MPGLICCRRASLVLLCLLAVTIAAPALRAQTGVFIDRDGQKHPWSITEHNALIWDGKPYIPFGGMFVSMYLRTKQDKELRDDQQALKLFRSQGVDDLYVNAMWDPPPAVMQKLLDTLEQDGFHYGIQLPVHANTPMVGYRISPTDDQMRFKAPGVAVVAITGAAQAIASKAPAPDEALYVVVNAADGALITSGVAPVDAQGACQIKIDTTKATDVLVKCSPRLVVGNWIAANADHITPWLRGLRFGAGLRFLLDPVGNEYGPPRYFLAASAEARAWVAAFLTKRYGSTDALAKAWGLKPGDLSSFTQAARLVPMIAGPKASPWAHLGYVMDPQTRQVLPVDMTVCRMWLDLSEARDLMLNENLGKVCDQIRRVVDVPVVAKRHYQSNEIWTDRQPTGGLDGLGMESYGTGEELAYFNATATYADVAQSKRPMWCLVTEFNCSHWEDRHIAYQTRQQMYRDFNLLLSQGAKGIFMFGLKLRASEGDNQWTIFELSNDPKQMRWLADFAQAARADTGWLDRSPDMVFVYPTENTDANAFLRSDMPEYGISGNWTGRSALVKLATGKWAAPVYNPTGLKYVLVKPGVLDNPVLSHEREVLRQSGVTPIFADWGQDHEAHIAIADRLTDGFKPVVPVGIHDVAPGVVALTWTSAQYGPVVRLEASGPTEIITLSSQRAHGIEINEDLRPGWRKVELPATLVLPYTTQKKTSFSFGNAGFGVRKTQVFSEIVGANSGGVTLRGVSLSDLKIEVQATQEKPGARPTK